MCYEHSVMCCEHPRNGLRTFREMVTNTHEMGCEHSVKWLRTPTKLVANIPPGVGADSSCPYPNITKNAYFHT